MCFPSFRRPKFIILTKGIFSFDIFCREKKKVVFCLLFSAGRSIPLLKALCLEWKKRLSESVSHRSLYSTFLPVFSLVHHFHELCPTSYSSNIVILTQKADIHRYSEKLLSHILQHCDEVMKSSFLLTSQALVF